jgi:hypothetical protein|tara:strand:+ start:2078 stop:2431 length:354 start_codon:yes stop_codon:yes gene_type:complete
MLSSILKERHDAAAKKYNFIRPVKNEPFTTFKINDTGIIMLSALLTATVVIGIILIGLLLFVLGRLTWLEKEIPAHQVPVYHQNQHPRFLVNSPPSTTIEFHCLLVSVDHSCQTDFR